MVLKIIGWFTLSILLPFALKAEQPAESNAITYPTTINSQPKKSYQRKGSINNDLESDNRDSISSLKVIKHVTLDEGILYDPKPIEVILSDTIRKKLSDKAAEMATWTVKQSTDEQFIPNCIKDETIHTEVRVGGRKIAKGTLVTDVLFLRKSELPEDPVDLFGPTALIYPYEMNDGTHHGKIAKGFGVSCLPYRIRITDQYTERLLGKDALKNYGKDLTGKGSFHKDIKKAYR